MSQNDGFTITKVAYCYHRTVDGTLKFETSDRLYHGITFVVSGSLQLQFSNGMSIRCNSGEILIHKKGDSYTLSYSGSGAEYYVISYNCNSDVVIDDLIEKGRVHNSERPLYYAEKFRAVNEEERGISPLAKSLERAIVQEIICNISKDREANEKVSSDIAYSAKRFIDINFGRQISVSDIAKSANCSESYLRQIFRGRYGISPNKYLNQVRVEHAKNMLRSEIFTSSEIASECGFKNIYYFGRVFKELTGVSPKRFVK